MPTEIPRFSPALSFPSDSVPCGQGLEWGDDNDFFAGNGDSRGGNCVRHAFAAEPSVPAATLPAVLRARSFGRSDAPAAIIGVAGLPGSGKSHLLAVLHARGFARVDDLNIDWRGNLRRIRRELGAGRDVALADIMFCQPAWRRRLERELGHPIRWIFFENQPLRCIANCLHRFIRDGRRRPIMSEIRKIGRLALAYRPAGEVRTIVRASAARHGALLRKP